MIRVWTPGVENGSDKPRVVRAYDMTEFLPFVENGEIAMDRDTGVIRDHAELAHNDNDVWYLTTEWCLFVELEDGRRVITTPNHLDTYDREVGQILHSEELK